MRVNKNLFVFGLLFIGLSFFISVSAFAEPTSNISISSPGKPTGSGSPNVQTSSHPKTPSTNVSKPITQSSPSTSSRYSSSHGSQSNSHTSSSTNPYGTTVSSRPSTSSATGNPTPPPAAPSVATSSVPSNTPEPAANAQNSLVTTEDPTIKTKKNFDNDFDVSVKTYGPSQFEWTQAPKDLPEVESSEIELPEVIASDNHSSSNNFVAGIVAWSCILVGVIIILFVLFSSNRHRDEISLNNSATTPRKKRKSKRLLSDKYYKK